MKIRTKKGEIKEIIYNEQQLYNYGINRISSRDYLRAELFTKMSNLQPDPEMVNRVLDKLTNQGYIDDKRRIRAVFNSYSSKESSTKTKNRLIQKGASKELIEEVLYELEEDNLTKNFEYDKETDAALILLDRKFRTYNHDNREKMLRLLISKGYNYSLCTKILKIFQEQSH